MITKEEIRNKLGLNEENNRDSFDTNSVEVEEKSIYTLPLPKMGLVFLLCTPLIVGGLMLINHKTPVNAQKEGQKKYSDSQLEKFQTRINELEDELFEVKAENAFMSEKEETPQQIAVEPTPEKKPVPQQPVVVKELNNEPVTPPIWPQYKRVVVFGAGVNNNFERQTIETSSIETSTSVSSRVGRIRPLEDSALLSERALLSETPYKKLRANQKIKAVLSTPITIIGGNRLYSDSVQVVILEPLKSQGGKTLIAQKTKILVSVVILGEGSLIKIVPNAFERRGIELKIPRAVATINGLEGQPILTESKRKRGLDAGTDLAAATAPFIAATALRGNQLGTVLGRELLGRLNFRNRQARSRNYGTKNLRWVNAGTLLEFQIFRSIDVPVSFANP